MTDDTQPTRFYIERLEGVTPNIPWVEPEDVDAWIPIGSIDIEPGEFGAFARDAFTAWEGEQEPHPPVGAYRVWKHETYGMTGHVFEITERVEREITRVEGPAEQQLRDDIVTLSIAARTPAEGQGAA